jgi:hypothetical protein
MQKKPINRNNSFGVGRSFWKRSLVLIENLGQSSPRRWTGFNIGPAGAKHDNDMHGEVWHHLVMMFGMTDLYCFGCRGDGRLGDVC